MNASTVPADPIGIGVIGAGYWGPNLVRNFQASDSFRLRWLCDLDLSRAERALGRYTTVRATVTLDDVLNDDAVHAVAIATPASTHVEIAMAALRAGKHVLVEKPLAATHAEGARLVAEADRLGLTLMCDHTFCYTTTVLRIRDLISSGDLGDLQYLDSVRINLGLVQRDIDVIWDLAPHDLSILDFILPKGVEPIAVSAIGSDPIGADRACIGYLTVQLTGGSLAHFHVNWLSPVKVRTIIIGGSKRTLVWDDLNPTQRLSIFDRGVDMTAPESLGPDERRQTIVSYRTGDMIAPALNEQEALRTMVEQYAMSIRSGLPAPTDGRSGLRVLEILEGASLSLANGGALVPLGPAARRETTLDEINGGGAA